MDVLYLTSLELNTLVSQLISETESEPESEPSNSSAVEPRSELDVTFGKKYMVYTRRLKVIPKLTHVQEPNSTSNEVINFSDLHDEMKDQTIKNDLGLPIAIRKGTSICTKQPLYPFLNCFSFKQ